MEFSSTKQWKLAQTTGKLQCSNLFNVEWTIVHTCITSLFVSDEAVFCVGWTITHPCIMSVLYVGWTITHPFIMSVFVWGEPLLIPVLYWCLLWGEPLFIPVSCQCLCGVNQCSFLYHVHVLCGVNHCSSLYNINAFKGKNHCSSWFYVDVFFNGWKIADLCVMCIFVGDEPLLLYGVNQCLLRTGMQKHYMSAVNTIPNKKNEQHLFNTLWVPSFFMTWDCFETA